MLERAGSIGRNGRSSALQNADRVRYLSNWGIVGVFASVIAHMMLAWGVFFNWGSLLLPLTFVCMLSILALLTSLSFFLALGNVRRGAFTRLLTAVFLTWVLIGVIYGAMALLNISTCSLPPTTPAMRRLPSPDE
jgi:hypothetical protein